MVFYLTLLVLVIVTSFLLSAAAVHIFQRLELLEEPSERGLLDHPAAKGGGWVFLLLIAALWPLLGDLETRHVVVLLSALALGAISWLDDLRSVSPLWRLILQILVVALCLALVPDDRFVFSSDLGVVPDRLIAGACWVWFINLFNFMDGIDGFAGVEAAIVAIGVAVIGTAFAAMETPGMTLAVIIAGAAAGFLYWNWSPSKILLGDVGAIPLGFLLGWLLIQLAIHGHILAAFILPLYFLTDASLTLAKRLLRGEAIWRPHLQHFYQLAAAGRASQSRIAIALILTNLVLLVAALGASWSVLLAASLAAASVAAFMVWLQRHWVDSLAQPGHGPDPTGRVSLRVARKPGPWSEPSRRVRERTAAPGPR